MPAIQISIFVGILIVFGLIFSAVQHGDKKQTNTFNPFPTQSQSQTQTANPPQQAAQAQPTDVIKQTTLSPIDLDALKKASISATIKTTKGTIELLLATSDAPYTTKNFIDKSETGYYKGLIFHRVEDWVIQGGDPLGTGTGGGKMPTELNQRPFIAGSLGVARANDIQISNDSQFFITKSDATHLNGQYTNFGQVTAGMDVVNKIAIGDKILSITIDKK